MDYPLTSKKKTIIYKVMYSIENFLDGFYLERSIIAVWLEISGFDQL